MKGYLEQGFILFFPQLLYILLVLSPKPQHHLLPLSLSVLGPCLGLLGLHIPVLFQTIAHLPRCFPLAALRPRTPIVLSFILKKDKLLFQRLIPTNTQNNLPFTTQKVLFMFCFTEKFT